MNESTRSRQTVFSRCWGISLILSVALTFVTPCNIVALVPDATGMPSDALPFDSLRPYQAESAQQLIPEDFSFPVAFQGAAPTISDFLVAVTTTQEAPGELMDDIGNQWKEYCQGHQYKGLFTVDNAHGYVRYFQEYKHDDTVRTELTEFRCWACDDGNHQVIATTNDPEHGECRFVYEWNGDRFVLKEKKRLKKSIQ